MPIDIEKSVIYVYLIVFDTFNPYLIEEKVHIPIVYVMTELTNA